VLHRGGSKGSSNWRWQAEIDTHSLKKRAKQVIVVGDQLKIGGEEKLLDQRPHASVEELRIGVVWRADRRGREGEGGGRSGEKPKLTVDAVPPIWENVMTKCGGKVLVRRARGERRFVSSAGRHRASFLVG
jgi:hypothetical protein